MDGAAAKAPVTVVQMDMNQLVELLVRRMADEQINPLREDVADVQRSIAVLTEAVQGRTGVVRQIQDLTRLCHQEHAVLHKRVTDVMAGGYGDSPEKKDGDETVSSGQVVKQRMIGAGLAIAAITSAGYFLLRVAQYLQQVRK